MKKIKLSDGVYTVELENNDEPIAWDASFLRSDDLVELHIPDGATTIADRAFRYCDHLLRIYMPASVASLGESVFYGVYQPFEIYYDGTSAAFREIGRSRRVIKDVQVPGKYDVQPYCNTAGTYYEKREVSVRFDNFCSDCQVVCSDGVRLYYGSKSSGRN